MFLAHAFDAMDGDQPYSSPEQPRLAQPELRSRVLSYLATAPVPAPGYRTDGAWIWPESLIDHVRSHGVGPQRDLLDHMAASHYLPPDSIAPDVLERAARAAGDPPLGVAPASPVTYRAGYPQRHRSAATLIRRALAPDGSTVESSFGPYGWEHGLLPEGDPSLASMEYGEITANAAATVADQLCSRWHERFIREARESEHGSAPLLFARVFDGQSPAGAPWFSPSRLRILEPARRERIASYLAGGRLVVRAAGRMSDPLGRGTEPVVPLSYRTDGTWVWQEALAYYVRTRGVAPELELLCHIEERGAQLPESVPADVLALAAAVVKAGPQPQSQRTPLIYYQDRRTGQSLVRAPDGDLSRAETLSADLRWRLSGGEGGGRDELREITEAEAIQVVDDRWARASVR